jgi:predicted heme/steroid binding protein
MAGQDLSDVINNSPHGTSVLEDLEVIGELVEGDASSDLLQLTVAELAMYDGQDGNDAYVAVNGIIYDVTGVSAWTGGSHNGNMAGQDLSNVINNSPHGTSVLEGLTVVGELVE